MREVSYDQYKHISNITVIGNPEHWRSCGSVQEQWPFRLSAAEKFNVGPREGELAVTTPLHLQADTHTQNNFISSSLDFLLLS